MSGEIELIDVPEGPDRESLALEIAQKLDDGASIVLRGPPDGVREIIELVRRYGAEWVRVVYSPPWEEPSKYLEYAKYLRSGAPYRVVSEKPLKRRVLIRRMAKASFDYMDAPLVDSRCASLPHCYLCVDACPENAILRKKPVRIDLSRCSECGACANACPAGYLTFPSFALTGFKRMLRDSEVLYAVPLSKLEEADEGSVIRSQERSFPLVAVLLTREKGVEFRGIGLDLLEPYLEELESLPKAERRPIRIERLNEYSSMEATLIASELEDRDEWIELKHLNFFRVSVSDECTLCGVCPKVCPTKALRIVKEGEVLKLEFSHQLCIGCRACEESCPENAMELSREINPHLLITGDFIEETKDEIARCRGCGAPLKGTVRMIRKLERRIRERGDERYAELVWYCPACKEKKMFEELL